MDVCQGLKEKIWKKIQYMDNSMLSNYNKKRGNITKLINSYC